MPAHSLPSLRPSPGETCCNPILEPFSTPASSYHPESSLSSQGEPIPFLLASPEASPNTPISLHPTLPQRPPGPKTVGSDSSPLEIAPVPANLAPSPSTFRVIFSASSNLSSASPPSSLVLGNLELEFFPTPSSAVEIVPQSSPELSESKSSLYEVIPFLPAPLDISITTPILCHSTSSKRPPRLGYRHPPLVYELLSMFAPRLPLALPPLSRSGLARFNFAFVFITTAVLVSTLFNASTTLPTLAHKYWSKQEVTGGSQNGTFKTSNSCNDFAQQLRLGQLTPRAPCLIFDPGGPASSSSLKILSAHEDVCKHKSKTHDGIISRSTPASPFPFQPAISSFSIPGGVGFATRQCLQAQAPVI
ncbi:hypothetical protein EDB85DRAFT_2154366 [Lactarius pseudohatsudake]|nr:hypothetical protein EDB85DRAFT_2154366 [Lactarius pseudohatsudake]